MAVLAQEPFAAEYSTTTGDGAITLGGRIGNYKTLAEAGVADTNVVLAEIRLVSGGVTIEYEMGFYTYASSGPTLTIVGSPLRSSNSNNKVSWSAGTKQVVLSAPPFLYPRDDRFVLVGSADYTKRARFEVDGITAGQTRVITLPDEDFTIRPVVVQRVTAGTSPATFTVSALAAKHVISFNGLSHNHGSNATFVVQLGDAGGVVASGYLSGVALLPGATVASAGGGFIIAEGIGGSSLVSGQLNLTKANSTGEEWSAQGQAMIGTTDIHVCAGFKALSQPITTIEVSTTGSNFDAGTISVTSFF